MKIDAVESVQKEMERFVQVRDGSTVHAFSTDQGHMIVAQHEDTELGNLGHVVVFHPVIPMSMEVLIEIRDFLFPADMEVMIALPNRKHRQDLRQTSTHLWEMPFTLNPM